jgi:hypothetical protein
MQNEVKPASGLTNVINTIVSPKEAFEALREAPTWGWALFITIVVAMIASFLATPAVQHAFDATWPAQVAANPRMAGMSEAQLAQAKQFSDIFVHAGPIFVLIFVPIFVLIEAVIMLIFNAIGKGSGTFKSFWAASANIAIPSAAVGGIINLVVILMRGADSFTTMASVQNPLPTLATLAPHAGKLTNFLGAFGIFSLWGAGLMIVAMLVIGRTSKAVAWTTGIVSILIPALFTLLAPGAQ